MEAVEGGLDGGAANGREGVRRAGLDSDAGTPLLPDGEWSEVRAEGE